MSYAKVSDFVLALTLGVKGILPKINPRKSPKDKIFFILQCFLFIFLFLLKIVNLKKIIQPYLSTPKKSILNGFFDFFYQFA
ncbi:MAG: hypothetical protein COT31_04040 [Candidatus Moranbacteria bacterium CG08_land_8_20_14_0_20_34_16]|nr:MAG: hypothetical protein COT31_04040 [Candidatus Moranbacteria bacterium CG08_land_8_20_14_0_20_34_16]